MTNHIRTLLLDEDGRNSPGVGYPGEEYVPMDFRPAAMPYGIRNAWQLLFGRSPDRAYRNYRLRQYMALIHNTELAETVLADDPRQTYWPFAESDSRFSVYGTVAHPPGIAISGTPVADDGTGRSVFSWRVEVLNDSVSVDGVPVDLTFSEGVSAPFPLGAGLTAQVNGDLSELTLGEFGGLSCLGSVLTCSRPSAPGVYWIDAVARPGRDLGVILASAVAAYGPTLPPALRASADLARHWAEAPFLPLRLGAFVTAVGRAIGGAR